MRERPSPQPEQPAEEPKKSTLKKLAEHPLAKPLLIAGSLHLPLNERIAKGIEVTAHVASEALKDAWEREHMVLHPQSKEQQARVNADVAAREQNIDAAARKSYKAETEKKLESGEAPSLKRMQFDLEKLNGIPAAEVESAEKKADALIAKYSADVGDDLDEDELKRISTEMYGKPESYKWEQGSAVRYFNGGERNCVAVSRAQGIVMEGVLAHLPPEKRAHWRPATQLVKQHEMAAMEHLDDAGKRDALYILEGDKTRKWAGPEAEPGTVTLQMSDVKKALVSSSPLEAKAAGTGKPGEVKRSADIDAVTDEPVQLNIKIEGPLKGSDFVVQQAKREGIAPQEMSTAEIAKQLAMQAEQEKQLKGQTMEIEILRMQAPDDATARMASGKEKGVSSLDPDYGMMLTFNAVDARDFDNPSPEAVAVFGQPDGTKDNWMPKAVYYGNMKDWSPEAVRQALRNDVPVMSIQQGPDGRISKNFLIEYRKTGTHGSLPDKTVRIEMTENNVGTYLRPDDLNDLLRGPASTIDISQLDLGMKTDRQENIDHLKHMPKWKTVKLPRQSVGIYDMDLFEQMEGKIILTPNDYALLAGSKPEILDNPHVQFDINESTEELESLRVIVEGFKPGHPLLKRISTEIKKRQDAHPPQD